MGGLVNLMGGAAGSVGYICDLPFQGGPFAARVMASLFHQMGKFSQIIAGRRLHDGYTTVRRRLDLS
jgi:hypothetical protein